MTNFVSLPFSLFSELLTRLTMLLNLKLEKSVLKKKGDGLELSTTTPLKKNNKKFLLYLHDFCRF